MSILSSVAIKFKCLLLKILHQKHPGCKISEFDSDFLWADEMLLSSDKLIFAHSGGIGDILFSLHFCREFAEISGVSEFDYHILYGESKILSHQAAVFFVPLLQSQKGIRNVNLGAEYPENAVILDKFRDLKLNFSSNDIRSWYYNLVKTHLPREYWKPVIEVNADLKYQDKILICNTDRYCNIHIDLNYLKEFQNHLVFIGLPYEHDAFCRNFFKIPFQPCKDMLEMAQYMAGAKGFIGNQSGIYSLAECMKVPRILLAPEFVRFNSVIIPGPHNNHPIGGWCEDVVSTEKMIVAVKALLNKE